jgi:hypothetical protein
MNHLFRDAPLFVPGTSKEQYTPHELERRIEEVEAKQGITHRETSV